jgi:hypothetical protein
MSPQSQRDGFRSWKFRAALTLLACACLVAGLSQVGRLLCLLRVWQ